MIGISHENDLINKSVRDPKTKTSSTEFFTLNRLSLKRIFEKFFSISFSLEDTANKMFYLT